MRLAKRVAGKLVRTFRREAPQPESKIASDAQQYWSSSSSGAQQRDMSHWRGEGRWQDTAWDRIGQRHFEMFLDLKLLAGRSNPVSSMLEWGQGGGSNAVAFAAEVSRFVAVDISQPNLDECGRQLADKQIAYEPILIDAQDPESVLRSLRAPVELFLSTAVFQHFPSQAYGLRVLDVAREALTAGGIALVQTRYIGDKAHLLPKKRDYHKNVTYFTAYTVDEFWEHLVAKGFEPLAVKLQPNVNYAFYFARKN